MKKYFMILLIGIFGIGLLGCNKSISAEKINDIAYKISDNNYVCEREKCFTTNGISFINDGYYMVYGNNSESSVEIFNEGNSISKINLGINDIYMVAINHENTVKLNNANCDYITEDIVDKYIK